MAIKLAGNVKVGDVIKSQVGGDLHVAAIEKCGRTLLFLGPQFAGDAQPRDQYLACMPNVYLYVTTPAPTLFAPIRDETQQYGPLGACTYADYSDDAGADASFTADECDDGPDDDPFDAARAREDVEEYER